MTRNSCVASGCREPHKARGLCRRHYQQHHYAGTLDLHEVSRPQRLPGLNLAESLLAIGWDIDPETGCWLWCGSITSSGHGQLGYRGRVVKAHRAVYSLCVGTIPDGVNLRTGCGVKHCVNPDHLAAGREASASSPGPARGSRHGRATLTEEDVAAIRKRWATGKWRQSELARRFGVSHSTVAAIVRGRTWTHVPEAPDTSLSGVGYDC
jgi:hypothetical protein